MSWPLRIAIFAGLLTSACGGTDDPPAEPPADTSLVGDVATDGADIPTVPDGVADVPESDTVGPSAGIPKSLVIALDGVRPDALHQAQTPVLDALIGGTWQTGYQGAYTPFAQNLHDAVTVSGPNHVAYMTGATGQQHGVTSNGDMYLGAYDAFPHYLSLLEAAQPDLGTAYLFTWSTDVQIPSGADYVKDGEDADNVGRAVQLLSGTFDEPAGDVGSAWAPGAEVDAIFLFLDDSDHAGHAAGFEPSVASYVAQLESIDGQIGVLLDAIAGRPTFDDEAWQIVLSSDHGGTMAGHGGESASEHTIPFLVASQEVQQGRLPQSTRIIDGVPTVLTHMGVPVPPALTGTPRGDEVVSDTPPPIGQDLVVYLPFDGDLVDAAGMGHDAAVGAGSEVAPGFDTAGGKFGGYVRIDGGALSGGGVSYLSLGTPAGLDMGDDDDFTVSVWFRSHGAQAGDPVILGNKDWVSGDNPGWLLLANEGGGNSFGSNYASGSGDRIDLEDVDYTDTGWWFLAAVFRADGLAQLFAVDGQGMMRWMAWPATGVGSLVAALPLNVGQDGTGSYAYNLDADLDDLAIWRRALAFEEIQSLYAAGLGALLQAQR